MTPNVTLHRSKILNQPFQILNTGHGDANDTNNGNDGDDDDNTSPLQPHPFK